MITIVDLNIAINKLLKAKYPAIKVYGHEVVEGFSKPSFFVDIRINRINDATINIVEKKNSCMITYFSENSATIDNLTKVEEIKALLCCKGKNNKKHLLVEE